MHLTYHIAQLRAHLKQAINFLDFWQDRECLLADGFAARSAGPRTHTRVVPRFAGEDGTHWRRKNAGAPPVKQLPGGPVAGTSAHLIGVEKANGHINRKDVEIRGTVKYFRQSAHFANNRSVRVHDDDGPPPGGAVRAGDTSHSLQYLPIERPARSSRVQKTANGQSSTPGWRRRDPHTHWIAEASIFLRLWRAAML